MQFRAWDTFAEGRYRFRVAMDHLLPTSEGSRLRIEKTAAAGGGAARSQRRGSTSIIGTRDFVGHVFEWLDSSWRRARTPLQTSAAGPPRSLDQRHRRRNKCRRGNSISWIFALRRNPACCRVIFSLLVRACGRTSIRCLSSSNRRGCREIGTDSWIGLASRIGSE